MKFGIYKIINIANGKVYVGSSANLDIRWQHHKNRLTQGDHHNRHLQAAWNKTWSHLFRFEVIEYTENLEEREQFWIDELEANNKEKGYNKRIVAKSCLGMKRSEETKARMSMAQKGKKRGPNKVKRAPLSLESRQRISESIKGRKHTNAAKAKVSAALKLRIRKPESYQKVADKLRGRVYTEAHRKAMSEGKKNKKLLKACSNGHSVETMSMKDWNATK